MLWNVMFLLYNNMNQLYMHAKSLQSCLILCDSMDYSPPGFSVHGILRARILELVSSNSLSVKSKIGKSLLFKLEYS